MRAAVASSAAEGFERAYGRAPDGVWSAPGRVNLIGEHTDYNEGFVLPFAIGKRTAVAAGLSKTGRLEARSTFSPEVASASLSAIGPGAVKGWGAYVLGVAWALASGGSPALAGAGQAPSQATSPKLPNSRSPLAQLPGADLFVDSEVPVGAGLSSSAAIECATASALNDLWGLELDRRSLALAGHRAENQVVGAPTGVMDQFASMLGEDGAAVFLDCRSLATETIPLDLEAAGLALLVIDTREHHAHATGGYADRRASCEKAARLAGVRALRDVPVEGLARLAALLDPETLRRARHVVTENARVLETVSLLRSRGPTAIGPLLSASHASMRDDFEITTPALDLAVSVSVGAGALGARMTGGGFGGAAIALVLAHDVPAVRSSVEEAFAQAGFAPPVTSVVSPSAGAGRDI